VHDVVRRVWMLLSPPDRFLERLLAEPSPFAQSSRLGVFRRWTENYYAD